MFVNVQRAGAGVLVVWVLRPFGGEGWGFGLGFEEMSVIGGVWWYLEMVMRGFGRDCGC